jgi:hypothetical protein
MVMYEILHEVIKGKGAVICKIPIEAILKHHNVKIKNAQKLQTNFKNIIDNISKDEWMHLFEHGIINKYGYPVTYEFSKFLGVKPSRQMYVLKRPSKNVCNSTIDILAKELYDFSDGLVYEVFGSDFKLDKISILLSEVDARDQVEHIDYEGTEDDDDTDFAIIFTYKVVGCVNGYDYSQHIVHACEKAANITGSTDPAINMSHVRDELANNGKNVSFDKCVRKQYFFGIDEMMIFGGNYVHGGAKNNAHCRTNRVHLYVSRKNYKALKNNTVVIDNIIWDLIRSTIQSVNFVFESIETREDYMKYKRENKLAIEAAAKAVMQSDSSDEDDDEQVDDEEGDEQVDDEDDDEQVDHDDHDEQVDDEDDDEQVDDEEGEQDEAEDEERDTNDGSQDSEAEIAVEKKKRGRPKKVSVSVDAPEQVVQKKRGRPRKIPLVIVGCKKAGRPRKLKNRVYTSEKDRPKLGRPKSVNV